MVRKKKYTYDPDAPIGFEDADDGSYIPGKNRGGGYQQSTLWGVDSYYGNASWKSYGWWGNYSSTSWGKTTYNYDSIEEQLKRKKKIEKSLDDFKRENNIIAKTYINAETNVTRKAGMYTLSIDNSPEWRNGLALLKKWVDVWKRLPSSRKVLANAPLFSTLINCFTKNELPKLFQNTTLSTQWAAWAAKAQELMEMIATTLGKSVITDPEVDALIAAIPEKIKEELEEHSWHGWVSSLVDSWKEIKPINKPLKITKPTDKFLKFPHLVKGKRINRGFINNTDYRPLRRKEPILVNRKKLLILLDGSGSMSWRPYHLGVNFIGELIKLDMFDIDVYQTTSVRVTNVNITMKRWLDGSSKNKFIDLSGSEWFDMLTNRMSGLNRDEDYVLVITDMDVPSDAESNLKAFIGNKKHLILSFNNKWTFGMNVRVVKKYLDMANVVTTLLA